MGAGGGEVAADADADSLRCDGHGVDLFLSSSVRRVRAAGAVVVDAVSSEMRVGCRVLVLRCCGSPAPGEVGTRCASVPADPSGRPAPSAGPTPPVAPPIPSRPTARARCHRIRPGSIRTEITMKTQYVVVYPPPRYEIVGLLQQCSYAPVNEHRDPDRSDRAANSLFGGRSRRFANHCWARAPAGASATRRPASPGPPDLTTVPLWPPAPPSASPSTPAPPASGPWSSTSRPGWWTSPTGS